jgi:hypothetical protein
MHNMGRRLVEPTREGSTLTSQPFTASCIMPQHHQLCSGHFQSQMRSTDRGNRVKSPCIAVKHTAGLACYRISYLLWPRHKANPDATAIEEEDQQLECAAVILLRDAHCRATARDAPLPCHCQGRSRLHLPSTKPSQ